MPFDSLIKLRQLNQPELSGYISQVVFPALRSSGITVNSGLFPTASGTENIGSSGLPFNKIYAKQLVLPSGSGILFGSDFFTARVSGTDAIIQIGSYTITSSPIGLSIIGPSGHTGLLGATGATGASGTSVTGTIAAGDTGFRLLFSNGTTGNALPLPSGATGPTGISVTGFYQSGNYAQALFSNGTTGTGILLPSGARGLQGKVGGIIMNINDFTGFSGVSIPKAYIYDIDPLGATYNPTVNLVRGMSYDFGYSGLNLSRITITGNGIDYPTGTGIQTNYFVESGITGYLKLVFFSSTVLTDATNPKTGRYISQELSSSYFDSLNNALKINTLAYNIEEQGTRAEQTFAVRLSSDNSYKWGFQKYNFYNQEPIDSLGAWGFYVLGDTLVSHYGPSGLSGRAGNPGIPGTQGEVGLRGLAGTPGNSITGIERTGNDFRFALSDGTFTAYTTLPAGGTQGNTGPIGPAGTGAQGIQGAQGPSGIADRYAAAFGFTQTFISGSGDPPQYGAIAIKASGASAFVFQTGIDRKFRPGDEIRFSNSELINKSYTPWQRIIVADSPTSRAQYFYSYVVEFTPSIGLIDMVILDTPTPIGLVGGYVTLGSYATLNVNLGGLGSPGEIGLTGPTGSGGLRGDTGTALFVINPLSGLFTNQTNTLNFNTYDAWDLFFTGYNCSLILNNLQTGQMGLLNVRHSGLITIDNNTSTILNWPADVYFPGNVTGPAPVYGLSSIFTLIRYSDKNGSRRIYCTYSSNYAI